MAYPRSHVQTRPPKAFASAPGEELNSSVTPVRDALHRLVGERLVQAPRNDGFRVPIVTELLLRELYDWQADLARLAVSHTKPGLQGEATPAESPGEQAMIKGADLFLALGRASGNWELLAALANACDRLSAAAHLEGRFLPDLAEEIERFASLIEAGDLAGARAGITAYQKRRDRIVPQLVAALQRSL